MLNSRLLRRGAALLTAGLVAVLAGCGGSSGCTDVYGAGCSDTTDSTSATDLRITLSDTTLSNTATSTVTATITAVDDGGVVVSDAAVGVSVSDGAQAVVSSSTTDSDGTITATITVGSNRADRTVTLTATLADGNVTRSASFLVVGAALTATSGSGVVAPGDAGTVTFTLVDAGSNPLAGQTIEISAAGLPSVTATTGSDGVYIYNFTAPSTTGEIVVTGVAAGVTASASVNVQSDSSTIPVVTDAVLSATVSVNPSVVAVNTGATSNSATVKALFVGADNERIQNVRVRFELPDPNKVGGTLDSSSNVVYSDASGFATTIFRPASVPSPTNGVTVRACWGYADAELAGGACPNSALAYLTVVSDALRVTIGTDELVGLGTGTYTKDFSVIVVDAAGRAKEGVEITPSIDLTAFYKGFYYWTGDVWARYSPTFTRDGPYTWTGTGWSDTAGTQPACPNEDVNRNGVREDGEDLNGNSELDPAGVTIVNVGSSQTDSSGKAIVRIEYSRDRATWIDYKITITASVSGSEGKAVYVGSYYGLGNLPAPGDAVSDENVFPAFGISPYGRNWVDANSDGVVDDDEIQDCTNTN